VKWQDWLDRKREEPEGDGGRASDRVTVVTAVVIVALVIGSVIWWWSRG
jgi:hypothetical protein